MDLKSILKSAFMIIGVMALGMLLINQTFGWYYKAIFLVSPCNLCTELNSHYCDGRSHMKSIPSFMENLEISPESLKVFQESYKRENKSLTGFEQFIVKIN